MAMKISENTNIQLDLKTIGMLILGSIMLAGTYFTLQAQIKQAMEEPKPEISKIEFEYKDELVRSTVEKIEADVNSVKQDVEEIKETLNKMDERLYQLSIKE
jgi:outer membrane murein-binding lipoprotein Lpp